MISGHRQKAHHEIVGIPILQLSLQPANGYQPCFARYLTNILPPPGNPENPAHAYLFFLGIKIGVFPSAGALSYRKSPFEAFLRSRVAV